MNARIRSMLPYLVKVIAIKSDLKREGCLSYMVDLHGIASHAYFNLCYFAMDLDFFCTFCGGLKFPKYFLFQNGTLCLIK